MARPGSDPTSTVSICVADVEHRNVRDAAAAARMAVSAWGASRLAAGIASPAARKASKTAVERIAAAFIPRGARSGRVSMVLRVPEHEALKAQAEKIHVTPHALCQAIIIDAAAAEVEAMPAPVRREVEATKREARSAGTAVVRLPADLAAVDPRTLSDMLAKLVLATSAKILEGGGKAMAEGVVKMAARLADVPMVGVKVSVPELHFAGPAFVLDVPVEAYATTLAVKAARVILAAS